MFSLYKDNKYDSIGSIFVHKMFNQTYLFRDWNLRNAYISKNKNRYSLRTHYSLEYTLVFDHKNLFSFGKPDHLEFDRHKVVFIEDTIKPEYKECFIPTWKEEQQYLKSIKRFR